MSRPDAERSMEIYRNFIKQTDFVVAYLSTARQYQHQTRVEIPKLRHAPINLAKSLEDYLKEEDFEINRRQYLAEQEAKNSFKGSSTSKPFSNSAAPTRAAVGQSFPDAAPSQPAVAPQPAKGPAPDLIDFFDSIEQNQQMMATQPGQTTNMQSFNEASQFQMQQPQFQQQPTGIQSQGTYQQQQLSNSFMSQQQPLQTQFTGAGFGGYTPQPSYQPSTLSSIPQDSTASFAAQSTGAFQQQQQQQQQQQTTNPFRLSMMAQSTGMQPQQYPASPPNSAPIQPQSTNPFAKGLNQQPQNTSQQPFSPVAEQSSQYFQPQQQQQIVQPLQSQPTGTNPFAKNFGAPVSSPPSQQPGQLMPQPIGNTNPFRQSQFVNTATGQGWQNNQGAIGGGLDGLNTVPVFPRPSQQQAWGT